MVDSRLHAAHAAPAARLARMLSTRTLQHFAEEARLDGESLREAVERYDIDYAWHVLASPRTRDAAVGRLEAQLQRALTDTERAEVVAALNAAAASQAPDMLMSFDNDVAQHMAELMTDLWSGAQAANESASAPA